jgi:hypothetical protein
MPNDPAVNADWKTYKTTIDEVERISSYDLLSLLPDKLETAVESNTILAAKALDGAGDLVRQLATSTPLNPGETNSLLVKIAAAQQQLGIGNTTPARNQLRGLLNELDAMVRSRRLKSTDVQPLITMVEGLLDSIS